MLDCGEGLREVEEYGVAALELVGFALELSEAVLVDVAVNHVDVREAGELEQLPRVLDSAQVELESVEVSAALERVQERVRKRAASRAWQNKRGTVNNGEGRAGSEG